MRRDLGQVRSPPLPPVVGPPEVIPPTPVSPIHLRLIEVHINIRTNDVGNNDDAALFEGRGEVVRDAPKVSVGRGEENTAIEERCELRADASSVLYPEHQVISPCFGLGQNESRITFHFGALEY